MDIGQWIVIGLSILLGLWFLAGYIYNRRRAEDIYRWVSSGLKCLGTVSERDWIVSASSGARLVIGQAGAPFRRVEVVFLLESLEILPLWLFNRIRKKQDELVLKAGLRKAPQQDLEVARPGDRAYIAILAKMDKQPFVPLSPVAGFVMARRGGEGQAIPARLETFLQRYGQAVTRVSVSRKQPHLILRVNLPALRNRPAEDFFISVSELFSGI